MTDLALPFDKLPIEAGETVSFTRANGTFHRSFDEAFAASDRALYHFCKPICRKPRWVRIPYAEIKAVKLEEMKPPVLLVLSWFVFALAILGAVVRQNSNPWAWFVGILPVYFPYLAYKSGRNRLKLDIVLSNGHYRIVAPLDGYKEETAHDNALLREIHVLVSESGAKRNEGEV